MMHSHAARCYMFAPVPQDNLGSCAMLEACKYGHDDLISKLKRVSRAAGIRQYCCEARGAAGGLPRYGTCLAASMWRRDSYAHMCRNAQLQPGCSCLSLLSSQAGGCRPGRQAHRG